MESNADEKAMEEQSPDESKPRSVILTRALEQVQAGKALLVDVRRDEEWEEAHFELARHIPLDTIEQDAETAFADIDKQQPVFIH